MPQLLLLLLPFAAASGWYFAYKHYHLPEKSSASEQAGYFKGLNYLLNEQPDKAIDVFIDLLEVDDETLDIHLALGTLFRQRGEVEKSIRIHQNLIARPQITEETRFSVLNELGLDYMRAGLLDRAENIYLELEAVKSHEMAAIKQLLAIFQQEKEWLKAIEYALKLEVISQAKTPVILAHLHCEMALANQQEDVNAATNYLRKALKIDPLCVRANVLSAEISMAAEDYKSALKVLMKIDEQDPRFTPVYLDMLIDCFDQLGKAKQKFNFLEGLQATHASSLVLQRFVEALLVKEGRVEAVKFMRSRLAKTAQHNHLKLYARLALVDSVGAEDAFLCGVLKQLDDDISSFQCQQCGFTSSNLNWCCPSCKQWGESEPCLV